MRMSLQSEIGTKKRISWSDPKEITYKNENNNNPLNAIRTNMSKNDEVEVKIINNKEMKRKSKFSLEGLLINSEMTL